jgi:hypothetical protein
MNMESNKSELIELSEKTLRGIKEASRKLVEKSAANNRSLVVYMDGEIKKVPAKDLLSKFYPNQ